PDEQSEVHGTGHDGPHRHLRRLLPRRGAAAVAAGTGAGLPAVLAGPGLRASLLPDSMAAVEIGGSWRLEWVFIVLGLWALIGLVLAPKLLSRMTRRESGSAVAARRKDVAEQ